MDKVDLVIVFLVIALVSLGLFVKWGWTFQTAIDGKVIQVQYSNQPPFPCTIVTFTSLGDSTTSVYLSGTQELGLKIGSTYRISYSTPYWCMYAVPSSITLIS